MLAIAPATAGHYTTGEFINDHRFAVANDVVDVLDEQILGLEGIGDVVGPGVLGIEQILHPQHLLSLGEALIGEGAAALLLVDLIVAFRINSVFPHLGSSGERLCHLGRLLIFLLGPLHLAGNDQRCAGFIDQDRINLVDHAVLKFTLNNFADVCGHVVPQVVEAQLGVGGVGDVAVVVAPAFLRTHVLLDQTNRKAEEAMHLTHPFRITAGEVVVDGDHMDTTTGEGIEVAGQRGHKGFAFPGFHLSDLTLMQHHAADQLHIEVAHAEHTLTGLTHHCKGLRQDLIEDRPLILEAARTRQPLLKGCRFIPQGVI